MADSIPSTPEQSGEPKPECGQVMESHLRGALYCTKPKGHWRDPDIMVRAHSNGVSMWPAYEDKVGGATCGYPVVGDGAACVLPADHEGECTAEEPAPSGESGVPTRGPRCECGHNYGDHNPTGTICRACDCEGFLDSTPPVSSPEKPERDFFDQWNAKPCDICGGPRNYRVSGQLQVICFYCAVPAAELRKRLDDLLWDATFERTADKLSKLGDEALREVASLPTYEEVESLLDDIVSRIRPVIAGLHRDLEEARKESSRQGWRVYCALTDTPEWHSQTWSWDDLAGLAKAARVNRAIWRTVAKRLKARAEPLRVAANAVGERNEELERRLADAVLTARYESDVAKQAVAALATAERERDEARKGKP